MPARTPGRVIPPGPADFEARLRSLERQVGAAARAPAMPETSQTGGSMRLYAPDGVTELLRFGDYNDADDVDRYGVALFDAAGSIVMATDETDEGMVFPGDNQQWGPTAPVQITTTGAFQDDWSTALMGIDGDAIYARAAFQAIGCTAEVKITWGDDEGNTGDTNTVTALPGYNGAWVLSWRHPFPIGVLPSADLETGYITLRVNARRVSGAGTVYVYRPRVLWCGSRRLITPTPSVGTPLSFE